jgi:hypothetical protein
VNALADDKVGGFINKHFVATFQRVGSFKLDGKQKQGGNVATYFCAPDGRVLNAIAGPVEAKAFLEEAQWTVERTREAIPKSKGDANKFKALLRGYHADRLLEKHQALVTPLVQDQSGQDLKTALAYRDAEGRKLAPVLPLPPIENASEVRQLPNDGKIHQLLAAHAGAKIEALYGAVFQSILNEKVTTKPVEVKNPLGELSGVWRGYSAIGRYIASSACSDDYVSASARANGPCGTCPWHCTRVGHPRYAPHQLNLDCSHCLGSLLFAVDGPALHAGYGKSVDGEAVGAASRLRRVLAASCFGTTQSPGGGAGRFARRRGARGRL